MAMDIKRKIASVAGILALALGAGQYLQGNGAKSPKPTVVSTELAAIPENIAPVAAGNDLSLPQPESTLPSQPEMTATVEPEPAPAEVVPQVIVPQIALEPAAEPETPKVAAEPAMPLPETDQVAAIDPCPVTLDLSNGANAMIGITLIAPCHSRERIVIRHAGLTVTELATVTGVLFADIPALVTDAQVSILFEDGTRLDDSVAVPEVAAIRRFGVQYQADDAFQLHAFENGASYGSAGDISATNTRKPEPGIPVSGGYLTPLGNKDAPTPLLAEVYTFPADTAIKAEVVVEAAVTDTACGREILGETINSMGGLASVSDLTVAMPQCDAVGDYLVLKNLTPDMNIASAE